MAENDTPSTSELLLWACYNSVNVSHSHSASTGTTSANQSQKSSSLDLLIFVSLLIMTILTIWMFKHIRVRFIHETGLAVIYGLIVGALIKYTTYGPGSDPPANCVYVMAMPWENTRPDIFNITIIGGSNNSSSNMYKLLTTNNGEGNVQASDLVQKASFNPEVFFNVILPPIIFCAGYSMKRKHFFKNFGAIAAYAFLGTIISSFVVGVLMWGFTLLLSGTWPFKDCLLFGAVISATDPVTILAIFHDLNVDVDLYALVFGESVLNDAVAITLVNTINNYDSDEHGFDQSAVGLAILSFFGVFFGSFALGVGMGCITALMTKFTHIRDYPLLETSLFVTMSYCTFLAAEAAGMTGIVAVLFCGISQAHYTYNNLSTESKARTKQVFELLNFLMENFVFAYIGVSTFTSSKNTWDINFIVLAFVAIIIARACNIYPLSALLNLGRSNKIRYNFQHLMMFSGLRGAMAFALAIRETNDAANDDAPSKHKQIIFSTTLVIVITTVILCGGLTTPMLQWLKIRVGVEEERELQSFESLRTSPSEPRVPHMELNPGHLAEKAFFVRLWYNFDANFVKPLLTHARPPLTENLPKCCLPLALLLTTEQQQLQATLVGTEQPDDSDMDLVPDDHELNYGERSDQNHVMHGANSVYNDNHAMVNSGSRASMQELVVAETHLPPCSHLEIADDDHLLDADDDHPEFKMTLTLADEVDDSEDVQLLHA